MAERALWSIVADSDSAIDYRAYLDQYPDGTFAALATARLRAAEQRATEETKVAALAPEPSVRQTDDLNGTWNVEVHLHNRTCGFELEIRALRFNEYLC